MPGENTSLVDASKVGRKMISRLGAPSRIPLRPLGVHGPACTAPPKPQEQTSQKSSAPRTLSYAGSAMLKRAKSIR